MSPNKKNKRAPVPPVKPAALKSKSNNSTLPAATSKQSKFQSNLDQKTVLRMEEFIVNIPGSEEFDIKSYIVNPGYEDVFPYLATVAPRFQFYRFKKLHFEFRTRCGSTQVGVVGMAPEYNSEEQPPSTIQTASNVKSAISDVPWKDIRLKCDPSMMFATAPHKSVRSYRGPESITYDALRLNIWREGQASTALIGALYAIYEIELWAPQIQELIISPRLISDFYNVDTTTILGLDTWQAVPVAAIYDPLHIGEQEAVTEKYFKPPPGAYRIIWSGYFILPPTPTSGALFTVGLLTEGNTVLNKAEYYFGNNTAPTLVKSSFYVTYNYVVVPSQIPGPKKVWIAAKSNGAFGNVVVALPHVTFEYA